MLDADLAALYGVETKMLNRAVSRNASRFPSDFMFEVTRAEATNLMFQSETSSLGTHGGRRKPLHAFTEQGVAMLSSVLRSERAVAVNILIMRTFVQLRRAISETKELGQRVDGLERRVDIHSAYLDQILEALRALESPSPRSRREIGFRSRT